MSTLRRSVLAGLAGAVLGFALGLMGISYHDAAWWYIAIGNGLFWSFM